MKKVLLLTILISFLVVGSALAEPLTFYDINDEDRWVSTITHGVDDVQWFELAFPGAEYGQLLDSGYNIDNFTVTLNGNYDDSNPAIDIYFSFNTFHDDANIIQRVQVENGVPFSVTLDILNNDFLYTGSSGITQDLGYLNNESLEDFIGIDSFWVGYGCHFLHESTVVELGMSPVPEPATMLLLGSGLVGLAGFGRKRFSKKA